MRNLLFTLLFVFTSSTSAYSATFYIDYVAGNNSNNGTSKATPWRVAPGMTGCTNSCAAKTPVAGDRFIFKGGVEWPASTLPLVISQINGTASDSGKVYFGTDLSWFDGSSYSRAIFNGEYSSTDIVELKYSNHVVIDGLELKGLYVPKTGIYGTSSLTMVECTNILIRNCFVHDWKIDPSATDDDAHGGIFFQNYAGSVPTEVVVDSCEISNSEWSTTKNNGVAVRAVQTIRNSKIHDVPTVALHVAEIYNNVLYNIDYPVRDFDQGGSNGDPYHTNLMYTDRVVSTSPNLYVYNNLIYNVGSGTGIYLEVCYMGNANAYVFNNVMYGSPNVGSGGNIVLDPEGGSGACGKIYAYNNTMENSAKAMANVYSNHTGTNHIDTAWFQNNHYITSGGVVGATTSIGNYINDATNIGGAGTGYTSANKYAPTSSTSITVGKGANLTSVCSTNAHLAALCFDTTLGGTRVPNQRPATGAWDVGAYQFAAVSPGVPSAPSNLRIQ